MTAIHGGDGYRDGSMISTCYILEKLTGAVNFGVEVSFDTGTDVALHAFDLGVGITGMGDLHGLHGVVAELAAEFIGFAPMIDFIARKGDDSAGDADGHQKGDEDEPGGESAQIQFEIRGFHLKVGAPAFAGFIRAVIEPIPEDQARNDEEEASHKDGRHSDIGQKAEIGATVAEEEIDSREEDENKECTQGSDNSQ